MRYILWTGGIDSTYLLCKCARENDEPIQPLYIIFSFPVAKSKSARELDAQEKLLLRIREKEEILAEIKEPILLQENELPENKEFDAIYDRAMMEAFFLPEIYIRPSPDYQRLILN